MKALKEAESNHQNEAKTLMMLLNDADNFDPEELVKSCPHVAIIDIDSSCFFNQENI